MEGFELNNETLTYLWCQLSSEQIFKLCSVFRDFSFWHHIFLKTISEPLVETSEREIFFNVIKFNVNELFNG